jgi:hypothetical protein
MNDAMKIRYSRKSVIEGEGNTAARLSWRAAPRVVPSLMDEAAGTAFEGAQIKKSVVSSSLAIQEKEDEEEEEEEEEEAHGEEAKSATESLSPTM